MKKYDVIIAGASFAGLALASRITKGKVLLIDRKEIGANQTSACGTTVKMVKSVGCEKSILSVFDVVAVHTGDREIDLSLPKTFCTVDYKRFCRLLASQGRAEFFKAEVIGTKNSTIMTDKGNFKAGIIVDCTGWQATLASSLVKGYVNRKMISVGIETEIPYKDNKLRFFVDSDIIENGAAWLFPCKKTARFGLGAYTKNTRLLPGLKSFVKRYNLEIGKIHGGFFGYQFRDPVVKDIFVVGEAAGQTLPLTGEGIRRSVCHGLKCGDIIQKVIDNKISLAQGKSEYRNFVSRGRYGYKLLLKAQRNLPGLSNWKLNLIIWFLSIKPFTGFAWRRYENI